MRPDLGSIYSFVGVPTFDAYNHWSLGGNYRLRNLQREQEIVIVPISSAQNQWRKKTVLSAHLAEPRFGLVAGTATLRTCAP